MIVTPLCFSTNLVFGKHVISEVAPFVLAFIRWSAVALILSPLLWRERRGLAIVWREDRMRLVILGFLGMWICGGMVYFALANTSATNGTLIYTSSSVMILLLEARFNGRPLGKRELAGSALAFGGIAVIVFRGNLAQLLALEFHLADVLFVAAALSWAFYSLMYRDMAKRHELSNLGQFAIVAAVGAATLLPFAVVEAVSGQPLPNNREIWTGIAGIITISSLLSFSGFQYGVRTLGPALCGIFMYLLPVYGVALAVLLLGEELRSFHLAGIALVLSGVALATFPARLLGSRQP
jgi:drug/metabolite transporter (DMT)-like permease